MKKGKSYRPNIKRGLFRLKIVYAIAAILGIVAFRIGFRVGAGLYFDPVTANIYTFAYGIGIAMGTVAWYLFTKYVIFGFLPPRIIFEPMPKLPNEKEQERPITEKIVSVPQSPALID